MIITHTCSDASLLSKLTELAEKTEQFAANNDAGTGEMVEHEGIASFYKAYYAESRRRIFREKEMNSNGEKVHKYG